MKTIVVITSCDAQLSYPTYPMYFSKPSPGIIRTPAQIIEMTRVFHSEGKLFDDFSGAIKNSYQFFIEYGESAIAPGYASLLLHHLIRVQEENVQKPLFTICYPLSCKRKLKDEGTAKRKAELFLKNSVASFYNETDSPEFFQKIFNGIAIEHLFLAGDSLW